METATTNPDAAAEFHLPRKFAYCHEVTSVDLTMGTMLRLFRNAPESVDVQIRTFGPTAESGRGVPKHMIAGTRLNLDEARQVRDQLDMLILAAGGTPQSKGPDSAGAVKLMIDALQSIAHELDYWRQLMPDRKDGEAVDKLQKAAEDAVLNAKTAMGWNRNHAFAKEVEGYWLSVIEREYDTLEAGTMRGRESMILSGPRGDRKTEFLRDGDFSAAFEKLTTAGDVQAFIAKMTAADDDA